MKDQTAQKNLSHLYRRSAFCTITGKIISVERAVKLLFRDSIEFIPLDLKPAQEEIKSSGSDTKMDVDDLKKFRAKRDREEIRNLNTAWTARMIEGKGSLRERMALFWHGHFACRTQNPEFARSYIETIRKHALGNFGEMLMAVSKEPAMLQFLNNQQNKKNNPNENFAREVMELFTVGRGNYKESDVKEAARAFTGWGFDKDGTYQFRKKSHDNGTKQVLGKTGDFQGEDVIKILLERKETAQFVAAKIFRSFVSEVPDRDTINALGDDFYKSGYDIGKLMRGIFESKWFYSDAARDLLVKSPVELLVGIQKTLNASLQDYETSIYIQKVLGQVLFNPPNVAGWAGGRSWIDSSSLLFRMHIPEMLAGRSEVKVKAKESGDVNDVNPTQGKKNGKATIDWAMWADRFKGVDKEDLRDELIEKLLAVKPSSETLKIFDTLNHDSEDRIQLIRKLTLSIMSLPEYQLA